MPSNVFRTRRLTVAAACSLFMSLSSCGPETSGEPSVSPMEASLDVSREMAARRDIVGTNELLDENGIGKIDLLSMDIEGSEPAAPAGFDIERFRPELAVVEVHADTREIIEQYFAEHGYRQDHALQRLDGDPTLDYHSPPG